MPSAAERTRTLVQGTCSAVLLIPGLDSVRPEQLLPKVRSVGPDGDVFLLFPADSPAVRTATHAQDDEVPAVLELTDVAPVAVPHRIRGRAWISGWLTTVPGATADPGRALVRLEFGEAHVDDLWGTERVDAAAFAAAEADPLAGHEAELLQHLHSGHGDQVSSLRSLLSGPQSWTPADRVIPLALDRFGLRVRFVRAAGSFDARFDFPEPVNDIPGLRRAMHRLFEAAAHD
ncbi:DUF2470 domain-containing protein [Streptomyces sp. NPDC052396]|uniref:DUF2470 domain-containing protein n=1 Tax=Streptomyces sp. NPDC052396 TaxID=3365689 RepID=UPI0037D7514A